MAATVIEVRGLPKRRKTLRQLRTEGGSVAVTVQKKDRHDQPHKQRNVALIALAVAIVAIAMSVIATRIALGRVSQSAEQKAQHTEEQSWCGVMGGLAHMQVETKPGSQVDSLMSQVRNKYAALDCPANGPTSPPHTH